MKAHLHRFFKYCTTLLVFALLVTNCERDPIVETTSNNDTNNALVFEALLETAKQKVKQYNAAVSQTSKTTMARRTTAKAKQSFDATYGRPVFNKTFRLTNHVRKPILIIPLIGRDNKVINLFVGYEKEDTETYRILTPRMGRGNVLYYNSYSAYACQDTFFGRAFIGGLFNAFNTIVKSKTSVTGYMSIPTDGCFEVVLCDENTVCFIPIDCDSINTGGGGGPASGPPGGPAPPSGSTGGTPPAGTSPSGGPPNGGNGGGGGNTPSGGIGGSNGNDTQECGDTPFDEDDCNTSAEDLKKLFPMISDADALTLASVINQYGKDFGIDTKEKLQHFLAQAGHETGGFTTLNVTESTYWTTASKLAKTYRKFTMDPVEAANNNDKYYAPDYLQNSSAVANIAMCCKYGNGSVQSGDGYKYRGRGIFQLTWKDNYKDFRDWYNDQYEPDIDPVSNPEIISSNEMLAIISGLWYYKTRVVDKININITTTVRTVTKPINPANKGISDRKEHFQKAKNTINCL